jgi:hypothetical protein
MIIVVIIAVGLILKAYKRFLFLIITVTKTISSILPLPIIVIGAELKLKLSIAPVLVPVLVQDVFADENVFTL